MRVLVAPSSVSASGARECLVSWSRSGLLRPFCWWPADGQRMSERVTRIDPSGNSRDLPLAAALLRSDPRDFALIACHPVASDEQFDPDFGMAAEAALEIARMVMAFDPSLRVECGMIAIPAQIGQPLHPGLFRARWKPNIYVAPEDTLEPGHFNQLTDDPVKYRAHAAHAKRESVHLLRVRPQL